MLSRAHVPGRIARLKGLGRDAPIRIGRKKKEERKIDKEKRDKVLRPRDKAGAEPSGRVNQAPAPKRRKEGEARIELPEREWEEEGVEESNDEDVSLSQENARAISVLGKQLSEVQKTNPMVLQCLQEQKGE